MIASLRLPGFRLFAAGTTLSSAAQWIQITTVSWVAYDLTGSGATLGTIGLARTAASLGVSPTAGVVVDRLDRRTLLLAVKAWLVLITLAMGALFLSGRGEVWHLFVFSLLAGGAQTFDMTLRQTATFDLVPRTLIPNALALIWTGWGVTRAIAPAIGGFLILWLGPGGNFTLQSALYGVIALSLLWLRFPPRPPAGERRGARTEIVETIRYVAGERRTRTFLLMGLVMPLVVIPNFNALPPIYAKDVFRGGPDTLGLLVAAAGAGGVLGGLLTAGLGSFERRGLVQIGALLAAAAALAVFASTSSLPVAMMAFAVAGASEMVYLTTNQTLLQLAIPDAMRGRATSVVQLSNALMPVGALFAGIAADLFGPRAVTFGLAGMAAAIAVTVLALSSTVRDLRLSEHTAPRPARAEAAAIADAD